MFQLVPVPAALVCIDDPFWNERLHVNGEQSLPKQYDLCKSTGRFDALKLNWKEGEPHRPHIFYDSDTAKWLEAACYIACQRQMQGQMVDAVLLDRIEEVAQLIIHAQQPDGYINSYFTQLDKELRWKNLRDNHELYCAGHIFEAAVAHYHFTGKDHLLQAACRYADYIDSLFGRENGKWKGYCGHEEIELALIKLYKATGNIRYRDLAVYFVEERGQKPYYFDSEIGATPGISTHAYVQAHLPVREQKEAVGHAVRAVYLYSAMADVAREMNDASMYEACERLWENLAGTKMYITGGIGSYAHNEGFGGDYDLPNGTAYCETCAGVGLIFWAHRMLQRKGDVRYAEIVERALYNNALCGMSLNGESFFYQSPLASDGSWHRQQWFVCACCPSNLSRLLGSLGDYIYSYNAESLDIWIHHFIGSSATVRLKNGADLKLTQKGEMPWNGNMAIHIEYNSDELTEDLALHIRIPDWASNLRMAIRPAKGVASRHVPFEISGGYALIQGRFNSGDVIELRFEMPVRYLASNPKITSNNGLVALQRGPFVYCVEDADYANPAEESVLNLSLDVDSGLEARHEPTMLGGVTLLESPSGAVFRTASLPTGPTPYVALQRTIRRCAFTAVPYFAWDNRRPGAMKVWLPIA
ncbi:hypothetical protein DB346_10460 [Verrucomicrobia bacterium LW23]|nr:hypothetical protein DB346_10460 [Verrucomicrobia bacterium LW23]